MRQIDHFTKECYFQVDVIIVMIDTQLQELNYMFNVKVMDLLSICVTLVPNSSFRSFIAM